MPYNDLLCDTELYISNAYMVIIACVPNLEGYYDFKKSLSTVSGSHCLSGWHCAICLSSSYQGSIVAVTLHDVQVG